MRSCPRTQWWLFYGHLEQSGKVKRLSEWVPCELTGNQKNHCFEVLSSYSMQQQQTISQSECNVQWILDFKWQPVMTSSVVGLRRSPQALPKAKLAPQKVMVTVWCSAAHLIHLIHTIAFSVLAKPLYLSSMLSKSKRCTKNCSRHLSKEWAKFFSTTTPDHTSHNEYFKSWTNWATEFCLSCHIHLTSCHPNHHSSSISTTFCWESSSTTSRMQKMLSKSLSNPEAWIFTI